MAQHEEELEETADRGRIASPIVSPVAFTKSAEADNAASPSSHALQFQTGSLTQLDSTDVNHLSILQKR